jgi:hypothetical protein
LDGVLAQLATDLSNAHIPDPLNSTNLLEGINTETLRWYADRLQDIRTGLEAATRMSDEQRAYEHVRALLEND